MATEGHQHADGAEEPAEDRKAADAPRDADAEISRAQDHRAQQSDSTNGGAQDAGATDAGATDSESPKRDPSTMSVDHLSQAFASLMGESSATEESASIGVHSDDPGLLSFDQLPPLDDADLHRELSQELPSVTADDGSCDVPAETSQVGGESTAGGRRRRSTKRPARPSTAEKSDETPATPESIVEAILFVGHPENAAITSRVMASYLRGVSPAEVDTLIVTLNEKYVAEDAPYEIVAEGAGYTMALRAEYSRIRDAFYGRVRETKLSQAAVDLLAIVAYQQPISRDQVDKLRGQPSGGVLSQLVRRQLLEMEYTQAKPRKKLYRTTQRFLDLFGLETLDDLPHHEAG